MQFVIDKDDLYNKIKFGDDNIQINICRSILDHAMHDCVFFVCEENIMSDNNIFCAIESFVEEKLDFANITDDQYDIMSRYFESINITEDIKNRICDLIDSINFIKIDNLHNSNNLTILKKFLELWIGIDEVLDNICNDIIKNML